MSNRLYLVTGALGHLGNTIIRFLHEKGEAVRGFALESDHTGALSGLNIQIVRGDVRSQKSLEKFFENPEQLDLIVIHTAGIVSIASKFQQRVYDVNVRGTANILAMCKKHNVKKLIHVSSVHAIPEKKHGEAISEVTQFSKDFVHGFYAQTKAQATGLVLNAAKNGLDACVVHPSGIMGPGDYGNAHLTQMVLDYLSGRLVACVEGGYDFVDVRDVAEGILSCVEHGKRGSCYILSNRYYSVHQLMDLLHQISGKKKIKTVLPMWLAKSTAPLAEIYYRLRKQPPLYTAYSLYTLCANGHFSHEKASKELGYHPRDLRDTLSDMCAWLVENKRV